MNGRSAGADTGHDLIVRVASSFQEIGVNAWASLDGTTRRTNYNPFVSFAFLDALERSGSATAATGWGGRHLLLESAEGRLLGASPCYLKAHSQGEYVFDHGWADAFHRAGGRYYPKLQVAVPFTPATGPRLIPASGTERQRVFRALGDGLKQLCERYGISSAHVTFAPENEVEALVSNGFLHRTDQQFHFVNRGYSSYEEFLATLSSRHRKTLRKERDAALSGGMTVEWLTGSDLTEAVWDAFFEFYMDTGGRKWGRPYLTRSFFSMVGESMAGDIVLIMACRGGKPIAGALNFLGSDTLFGRYWGCIEDHRFLHFELCYHQAIDYAIANGLAVVEAGAQGEHKLARGYMPVTTHSAHYISHPGLRTAVEHYLQGERDEVARLAKLLGDHGPFRKD